MMRARFRFGRERRGRTRGWSAGKGNETSSLLPSTRRRMRSGELGIICINWVASFWKRFGFYL